MTKMRSVRINFVILHREKNRSAAVVFRLQLLQTPKCLRRRCKMAWPARARMACRAPQRAVQVSGGAARPTHPSATQRDAIWNGSGYAVRRHHQSPECTRTHSNWKKSVCQCNGAKLWSILDIHIELERACVAIWAIWVQLFSAHGRAGGKSIIIFFQLRK